MTVRCRRIPRYPYFLSALEAEAGVFFAGVFFECFFAFVAVLLLLAAGVLLLAGAWAWAANANGMEATAKAIARTVFFIVVFSCWALSPAYSSILRPVREIHDSPLRLGRMPNSGCGRLRFVSLGLERAILKSRCLHA